MIVALPWRDTGCEWRRRSHTYTRDWWHGWGFEVVEVDSPGEPFSRGASLNLAFTDTTADTVIAADADVLVTPNTLTGAADAMVVPYDTARYLAEPETRAVWGGASPFQQPPEWEFEPTGATPLLGGINVVTRHVWEQTGGWPELRGWGCEDLIFAHACAVFARVERATGPLVHLYHPKTGAYAAADHSAALAQVTSTTDPDELKAVLNELRAS